MWQPSAANPCTAARPIPWLEAATMATRFLRPVSWSRIIRKDRDPGIVSAQEIRMLDALPVRMADSRGDLRVPAVGSLGMLSAR